jgi:zinc protease
LVGELLRAPSFPADARDEVKRQALSGIEQQRKEPSAVADLALERLDDPYPRGDVRYASSFDEMVQDVNAVTLEAVRAFHARFYGAGHGEFAAVGDMDVRQALQGAFGEWNSAAPFSRIPHPLHPVKPARLMLPTPDKQNAVMQVHQGVALSDNDADYAALMMANHLLGGGGNSRLWKRIRETEGLSYDVRSSITWGSIEANSQWHTSAIFAPQNLPKVETAFREELARALNDGFTAQELSEGQRGLLSFRRLSRAQDGTLASALANNLYLGRTFAKSAQVDAALTSLTLAQVNAALRKYVKPDTFAAAVAGDFKP